jgi:uncharacterized protein DUF1844
MAEKKPEFVISDRRRFGTEGELRSDSPATEEKPPATPAPQPPPVQQAAPPPAEKAAAPQPAQGAPAAPGQEEELPPPPTAEEQHEQDQAYRASGKKIDEMIAAAGRGPAGPMEMTFERVIESFYMSALIQMGALRQEGETPRVDIIGARQTIDSLTVLQEKTRGNLTDREKTLLQNVLFELRMAWIEITNAVATSGPKPGAPPPISKK